MMLSLVSLLQSSSGTTGESESKSDGKQCSNCILDQHVQLVGYACKDFKADNFFCHPKFAISYTVIIFIYPLTYSGISSIWNTT